MMDEPKFVASLEVEATPEELENLEKSSPMVDEEERNKFRAALKMQEPDLPKGRTILNQRLSITRRSFAICIDFWRISWLNLLTNMQSYLIYQKIS